MCLGMDLFGFVLYVLKSFSRLSRFMLFNYCWHSVISYCTFSVPLFSWDSDHVEFWNFCYCPKIPWLWISSSSFFFSICYVPLAQIGWICWSIHKSVMLTSVIPTLPLSLSSSVSKFLLLSYFLFSSKVSFCKKPITSLYLWYLDFFIWFKRICYCLLEHFLWWLL